MKRKSKILCNNMLQGQCDATVNVACGADATAVACSVATRAALSQLNSAEHALSSLAATGALSLLQHKRVKALLQLKRTCTELVADRALKNTHICHLGRCVTCSCVGLSALC